MARKKSPSRLDKRKEVEAAEALGSTGTEKKKARKKSAKKAATTTTKRKSRKKSASLERRRLVWGVFSSSMKEEARFPYDQRKEADEKIEQLMAKGKKMYFVQPIKELIPDAPPPPAEKSPAVEKKK
jgi:hypothetical protein